MGRGYSKEVVRRLCSTERNRPFGSQQLGINQGKGVAFTTGMLVCALTRLSVLLLLNREDKPFTIAMGSPTPLH